MISRQYLDRLSSQGEAIKALEEGQKLDLSRKYLHLSVDTLIEFGTLAAFIAWRKLGNEHDEPYTALLGATYSLITRKRYQLAAWLLDFALHQQDQRDIPDITTRMMTINLANCYKNLKDPDKMNTTLSGRDWSASSLKFQLCIASLEENEARSYDLLEPAVLSKEITKEDLNNWPVFDWIRGVPAIRTKFEELFGQEMSGKLKAEPQEMPAQQDVVATDTVH